jgi:acetolactate synthase-1/2/3 large subunit
MKFYEALARCVADHGTRVMFGLIGDGNLFFADAFVRQTGGRFIGAAHESSAVLMGHGYTSVADKLAVVTVTHGPGLTNTLTGLVEATKARSPILLIAGDTSPNDPEGPQNVEQRELVVPTGAGFHDVSPESLAKNVAAAVRECVLDRKPVVLNVPVQYMWTDIEYEFIPADLSVASPAQPAAESLEDAAALLATARRPLVLAGRGAIGARAEVLALAERLGAPLTTTLGAKDLFTDVPASLGLFGTMSTPEALTLIGRADCIVALGASLNRFTTVGGSLLSDKQVIRCDHDEAALALRHYPGSKILGDVSRTASDLASLLDEIGVSPTSFSESVRSRTSIEPSDLPATGSMSFADAVRYIDRLIPEDRVVVTDAGRFIATTWNGIRAGHPRNFVYTVNFGSIGLGMGAAIGAAANDPNRPVLLACGDGGFMHAGITEFNTAVREGIDLIVLVCNDGAYGAEHVQFVHHDMDPSISAFAWPDLVGVAQALGGTGVTVRTAEDLAGVARLISERTGPILIDLLVDPFDAGDVDH